MNLECTRSLIRDGVDVENPVRGIIQVLESAVELVEIPDNDFAWSSWESSDDAKRELNSLLGRVRAGDIPRQLDISVLFAPTGPLQELGLSSGWADTFLKISERFDEVERKLWQKG